MAEVLLKVTTGQVRVDCSGRGPVLHMAGTGETLAVASLFSAQHHCDAIASTNATVRVYAKRQVPDKDSKAGQAFSATLARQAYVLALSTASQRGVDNVMIFSEGRPLEAIKRMVSHRWTNCARSAGMQRATLAQWHHSHQGTKNSASKFNALSLMGIMVQGSQHQQHHLMMATGWFAH